MTKHGLYFSLATAQLAGHEQDLLISETDNAGDKSLLSGDTKSILDEIQDSVQNPDTELEASVDDVRKLFSEKLYAIHGPPEWNEFPRV